MTVLDTLLDNGVAEKCMYIVHCIIISMTKEDHGPQTLNPKPQIAQCPIRGLPCNPQCLNITSDPILSIYHCIASHHISVVIWAGFLDMHLEPYYFNAVASASGQFVHFKSGMLQSEDFQWHQKFAAK